MSTDTDYALSRDEAAADTRPRPLEALARHLVLSRLDAISDGELILAEGGRERCFGRRTASFPSTVRVEVADPRFYSAVAAGGSVGAGEAYMAGHWHTDDLTLLIRLMARNRAVLDGMSGGTAWLAAAARRVLHWLNRNTRAGSRRNIAAHYDLGNDFFELFLDETLMYSSAVFSRPDMTLAEASTEKLDLICRKLELGPGDHVLEIGTGWGGFALHAARHYGCRVTTTTISREQYAMAAERIAAAGLEGRVELLFKDYRELEGSYDKVVSIEMIEAVGHAWYNTFFLQCSRLLKPDGMMLLQAITIADQRYESARHSVDFIQRYIFPGGALPSVAVICDTIARVTDMRLYHLDDIGPHYATTLRRWRQRFFGRLEEVRALGYPDAFIRMWEFYLCYCEGGFAERTIGTVQMLLTKPDCRRDPVKTPA
jgi:cyclopropane-fatty-acyl-phospholipid synthase